MKKDTFNFKLCLFASILMLVACQSSTQLNGLTTGSIYLATNDLFNAPTTKAYTISLTNNLGNSSLSYALALAGFQAVKTQSIFTVLVNSVNFINCNTVMSLNIQFKTISSNSTTWLKLKWSYLVVSSTFDGTYTNIWATNAEFDPSLSNINNVPVDPTGSAFLALGGDVGDCDIFVDPLLQLDIPHCLAIPANGQYIGGKPIIHAYITGFSASAVSYPSGPSVSVQKGNNTNKYSDSQGWQIVYGQTLPNGPKVTIPAATTGLTFIQLSFIFIRMDYYAKSYPLNSNLQYSSSHVFTEASQYNVEVVLSQGDENNYNQNFYNLPDAPYLLYGLTAFSLNSQTNSSLFSVMVNMAKSSYWVISPSNSVQQVTISADMFIKNVMQICNIKQKEISLIASPGLSNILPRSTQYTAVDVTQLVPLSQLTTSLNPTVYRFGIGSSVDTQMVTFSNSFYYNIDPSVSSASGYLRIELLVFEKVSQHSLVQNMSYSVKMNANSQQMVNFQFVYKSDNSTFYRSSTLYKAAKALPSNTVNLVVSFQSAQTSQELYVLLAVSYHPVLYDPASSQCVSTCPNTASGVKGQYYPLTCVYCKTQAGFLFSTAAGTCICKPTTYLNTTTMSCMPCGVNCATCNPDNPNVCISCLGQSQLINGLCGCQIGQYLTPNGCVNCPYECSSCVGPNGLCLTCRTNLQYIQTNCKCASGYFDANISNCAVCKTNCLTCSPTSSCVSCNAADNRVLYNESCICKNGYFQSINSICQLCASTCLTCSSSFNYCTSCDANLNRVLVNGSCLCLAGFTQAGLQCVMTNCTANPLCAVCVNVSTTQNICIQCVTNLHRILNPLTNQCDCLNGYFSSSGECLACGLGCLLCSSLLNCTSCATLAQPQGDGTCLCPQTTFLAISPDGVSYCQNCGSLCMICVSLTNCNTCKPNSVLSQGICTCLSGYFNNLTSGQCETCSYGCSVCNFNGCVECQAPLLLSAGDCVSTCTNGYRQQANICVPCVSNCQTCLDSARCAKCLTSFYLLYSNCLSTCPTGTIAFTNPQQIATCQPCSTLCSTCSGSPSFCTSCSNGTYLFTSPSNQTCLYTCPQGTLTDGRVCQPCDNNCLACGGSISFCLKCKAPLILYKGKCVQSCPSILTTTLNGQQCIDTCPQGSFISNSKCELCNSQCSTCDFSALNCTSCNNGILADFGVCVSTCASNQYIYGGACFNCSSNCLQCFRRGDYCVKCSAGLILSANKCVHSCAQNQYYNSTVGLCLSCNRGCATCLSNTECLTCKNSAVLPVNGKCPFCNSPCLVCGNDGRCLRCSSTTYIFNGACLSSCPGITVPINGVCLCSIGVLQDGICVSACASGNYVSNDGLCQLCDANCLQCSGSSTNCTSCFYGSTLSNGTCVASIGCRYGQQLVNGQCSDICANNTYFYEGVCLYDKCISKFEPNSYGGCIRSSLYECSQGEYYYQGSCVTVCPTTYYGDAKSKKCLSCPRNCNSCVNGLECYLCSDNYQNIEGVCYLSNCSNGTVALGDTCTNSCPIGTKKQGNVCIRRCAQGSYYLNDFCYWSCPSGSSNGYSCI